MIDCLIDFVDIAIITITSYTIIFPLSQLQAK